MAVKSKILIVDDDNFNLLVIGEHLAHLGYAVDVARDGQEAWDKIGVNHKQYDLVLLDKVMPRMDGITLLRLIRANTSLSDLPVVMLTSANKPEDIVEGLAAGAYYYLIKPATQEVLSRVVQSALDESKKRDDLLERLGQHQNNLRLLRMAKFSYHTLQEARDLALYLADLSLNPERTVSGYSELLINAVEHGNLGITYAEKSQLLAENRWVEEVERRQKSPQHLEQVVEVAVDKSDDKVAVTITDQGNGFDWQRYLQFEPERAFDLHGRGIAMSKGLSFDRVEYVGKGNVVVATVLLPH